MEMKKIALCVESFQSILYRVYLKILRQISGVNFPHQNKEKRLYQYMAANNFRGTSQQRVDVKL
jgi:hypothetical protein